MGTLGQIHRVVDVLVVSALQATCVSSRDPSKQRSPLRILLLCAAAPPEIHLLSLHLLSASGSSSSNRLLQQPTTPA